MSKGTQAWFKIARKELNTAMALHDLGKDHYDFVLFLAQQVVEKSIKGYLTFLESRFPKTHDISMLSKLVQEKIEDRNLIQLLDSASSFTGYVIRFRYPQSIEYVVKEKEVLDATQLAQSIYQLLLDKCNESKNS